MSTIRTLSSVHIRKDPLYPAFFCPLTIHFVLVSSPSFNTVPSPVTGVEGHCSVIVWKEPNEPNGEISNYTLFFIPNNDGNEGMAIDRDDMGRIITTTNNQLFFVINNTFDLPENESIFVKVRVCHNYVNCVHNMFTCLF